MNLIEGVKMLSIQYTYPWISGSKWHQNAEKFIRPCWLTACLHMFGRMLPKVLSPLQVHGPPWGFQAILLWRNWQLFPWCCRASSEVRSTAGVCWCDSAGVPLLLQDGRADCFLKWFVLVLCDPLISPNLEMIRPFVSGEHQQALVGL